MGLCIILRLSIVRASLGSTVRDRFFAQPVRVDPLLVDEKERLGRAVDRPELCFDLSGIIKKRNIKILRKENIFPMEMALGHNPCFYHDFLKIFSY